MVMFFMKALASVVLCGVVSVSAVRDVRLQRLRRSYNSSSVSSTKQPLHPSDHDAQVMLKHNSTSVNSTKQAPQPPDHDVRIYLKNFQNIQYYGPMLIGGQNLPVVYDTGSFEIVIMSDLCDGCSLPGSAIYSSGKSTTFKAGSGKVHTHVYGSGPVTSKQALETIYMGDSSSPLVAYDMPFWQVMDHDVDVWHKYSYFSGIVGLGHSPHAPSTSKDEEKKWSDDKSLLEMVGVTAFSMCLERSPGTPPGWLVLGPTAEGAAQDTRFVHVPVVGKVHWGVLMTQLAAGGSEAFNACDPQCAAIVDSGTSLIAAPAEAMQALAPVFNQVDPGCNLDNLPDITFGLGDGTITIPPAIYVIGVTGYEEEPQNIVESLFGPPKLRKVTQCVPAFMEVNMNTQFGPLWILGMPFLRYYFTVFQRSPKSLHVAYATAGCQPSATPTSIYKPGDGPTSFTNTSELRVGREKDAIKTVNVSEVQVPVWARPAIKGKKPKPAIKIEF